MEHTVTTFLASRSDSERTQWKLWGLRSALFGCAHWWQRAGSLQTILAVSPLKPLWKLGEKNVAVAITKWVSIRYNHDSGAWEKFTCYVLWLGVCVFNWISCKFFCASTIIYLFILVSRMTFPSRRFRSGGEFTGSWIIAHPPQIKRKSQSSRRHWEVKTN